MDTGIEVESLREGFFGGGVEALGAAKVSHLVRADIVRTISSD